MGWAGKPLYSDFKIDSHYLIMMNHNPGPDQGPSSESTVGTLKSSVCNICLYNEKSFRKVTKMMMKREERARSSALPPSPSPSLLPGIYKTCIELECALLFWSSADNWVVHTLLITVAGSVVYEMLAKAAVGQKASLSLPFVKLFQILVEAPMVDSYWPRQMWQDLFAYSSNGLNSSLLPTWLHFSFDMWPSLK